VRVIGGQAAETLGLPGKMQELKVPPQLQAFMYAVGPCVWDPVGVRCVRRGQKVRQVTSGS